MVHDEQGRLNTSQSIPTTAAEENVKKIYIGIMIAAYLCYRWRTMVAAIFWTVDGHGARCGALSLARNEFLCLYSCAYLCFVPHMLLFAL